MTEVSVQNQTEYRVLARKYRPKTFDELIGHGSMVRTLGNAIETGRIAHAFVLTGVRGIGKTTTARIIARALNCVGPEGQGGPTIAPCGMCEPCRAIAEDRHMDVLEMDAASHTGVDDIRELIDSVRYAPAQARFKIFIIDEVHMLSKNAFNALLKTLEEPPGHAKFIFATTEIRKIPITVLSRCQRFDLRRVQVDELTEHYQKIAVKEEADIEEEAVRLIARAADGSVRDGLSLLDQAISHGVGTISTRQVRDMLGLADRSRVFDLYGAVMAGKIADALELLAEQYALGADPEVVLRDLLEITHWLTRVKLAPEAAEDPAVPELERERGRDMAAGLAMPHLTRTWQMLLKGLEECKAAPSPIQAAEMVLIRLAYASDLPSPADLVKQIKSGQVAMPTGGSAPAPSPSNSPSSAPQTSGSAPPMAVVNGGGITAAAPQPATHPLQNPQNLADVVALFKTDVHTKTLAAWVVNNVQEVTFDPRRHVIEFQPAQGAPSDLASQMVRGLQRLTGQHWMVSVSHSEAAQPTLSQSQAAAEQVLKQDVSKHPLVKAILNAFEGTEIIAVREPAPQQTVPENLGSADPDDIDGEDEI